MREYDDREVCEAIDELIALALDGNDEDVVRQMKRIVPEFKSRNSVFESLDKQPGAVCLHER